MTKRNELCPCGSEKKYKKCCLLKEAPKTGDFTRQKMRRTEGELMPVLIKFARELYGDKVAEGALEEYFCWQEMVEDEYFQEEITSTFQYWFLFNWVPEYGDESKENDVPETSVALEYLRKKGKHLPPFTRRFIEVAADSEYSFFLVTDVVPGESLTIKDLLLDTVVTVIEKNASLSLKPSKILYTRVITMDDTSLMLGGSCVPIPASYYGYFVEMRENFLKSFGEIDKGVLWDLTDDLRLAYLDIRSQILNPKAPTLVNTDGDPVQPTTIYYRLNCSIEDAVQALRSLNLFDTDEELYHKAEYDTQKQLIEINFSWMKAGNKQHAGWNNTIMGEIFINKSELKVSVNSQNRADEIKQKISERLGDKVQYKTSMIESVDKMMEQAQASGGENAFLQPEDMPEGMNDMLADMSKKHWAAWLDMSLPALDGQTPRQASTTKKGRGFLEVLLLELENKGEIENAFAPDISMLRDVLQMPK